MKLAYIIIGVSGSGKTTLTKKLKSIIDLASTPGTIRSCTFSLDECKYGFALEKCVIQDRLNDKNTYRTCFQLSVDNEKEFNAYVNKQWAVCLEADVLFIDMMKLTHKSRKRWVIEARQKGFIIHAIQVMAPLQTLINRQQTRGDKSVPESVVNDAYFRQQEVLLGSDGEATALFVVNGEADFVALNLVKA